MEERDGVRLYKYTPPPPAGKFMGYLLEFVYCWIRTALLSVKVWYRDGFKVIQACNPPDTYWALAFIYKFFGKKFVYDQHDLNPEVFRSRFGEPSSRLERVQYVVLLWLERRTYRAADHVITTNESYRTIARRRGHLDAEYVTVVRSGPNTARMRPIRGNVQLRHGRAHLLAYLGIMGPQDGVQLVLRVVDVIVNQWGRDDLHAVLMGFGDEYDALVSLASELGVSDYVTFTGRVGQPEIATYLSTASVGLSPDPHSPLNDVSTMNKTMEYMSFALPTVAFDLAETRITGGDAIEYVAPSQVTDDDTIYRFAVAVVKLLDDEERRAEMAVAGRRRAESLLDWAPQRAAYVGVFDAICGRASELPVELVDECELATELGAALVDIRLDDALKAFARDPISAAARTHG